MVDISLCTTRSNGLDGTSAACMVDISLYTIRSYGLGWHRRCLNGFIYIFCGDMPLFLRLFSFIQYITEHGRITSDNI
jgi:hypothetical protein